jgi:NAD-dependent deacetylase
MEEQMPFQTWRQAQTACKMCDLMLIAGSSLEMMPAAGLPTLALRNGARLIIINQSPTYIDVRADVLLQSDVAEILPQIAEAVIGE